MRTWEDVSKVAYRAAHAVKVNGFEIDELVNESYTSKWKTCADHDLYKTLQSTMRDAIKAVVGRTRDGVKDARKRAKEGEVSVESEKDAFNTINILTEKGHLQLENEELVKKLIKTLDSTAQTVVSGRIYKDRSCDSIGEELNISRFAVDRIWNEALDKMRDSELIKDLR